MATRNTPFAAGTPCWLDLASSDIDKTNSFYTELFGWKPQTSGEEFGHYVVYTLDGYAVAGAMPKDPTMLFSDAWTTYIATDDCVATVARAREQGGQVMVDVMEIPDTGVMAVLQDPAGAVFGLWQAGGHSGFGRYNEPGSVTWDEHQSKDFSASKEFYRALFGWDFDVASDTDDLRYVTAKVQGETVAGLMDSASFLSGELASHWKVYFSVASVDDAVAKLEELGGSVAQAGQDTPFGRMAEVADPTGAAFSLHQALADSSAGEA